MAAIPYHRRVVVDARRDRDDGALDTALIYDEVGTLLDERVAALAKNPNQKTYTLREIAARRNVSL